MTYSEYLRLHEPAVSWLCRSVGRDASKDDFTVVLEHYRDYCGSSFGIETHNFAF